MTSAKRAGTALDRDDVVEARIDLAAARDWSYLTFGWGAFALVALGFYLVSADQ